jgi:anti-sigma regulatory factor (Ser/Thr protein kinase)
MLSGKSGDLSEISPKFLNLADRNVNRLSGIINDLLDLSKIEAGKMDYRFLEFNIKEPIEQVCATFDGLAKDKNITLQAEFEEDLPFAYGDSDRIEQVLSNLIANAIKFTPENGHIKIVTKQADPQQFTLQNALKDGYLEISVSDNGIGIKQEDIPKVFDKFQQIESALVRKVGGTGLGLPIARQLIEAHRGTIWVESEINQGSTFSFIIPMSKGNNQFILELDKQVQYAKYNHSNLALIKIEQKGGDESFVNLIKEDDIGILQKYKNAKTFTEKTENSTNAYIILPSANKMAADIIIQKLKEYIHSNKNNYLDYNILMSSSIYPEGAITADELVEKTNTRVALALKAEG